KLGGTLIEENGGLEVGHRVVGAESVDRVILILGRVALGDAPGSEELDHRLLLWRAGANVRIVKLRRGHSGQGAVLVFPISFPYHVQPSGGGFISIKFCLRRPAFKCTLIPANEGIYLPHGDLFANTEAVIAHSAGKSGGDHGRHGGGEWVDS